MKRKRISSGDVCLIANLPPKYLERWAEYGLIEPENSGQGRGVHRNFSLSECVAIAAAARYRESGATFERVAGILRYLSKLPIEHLERELDAGRTMPVPATMLGVDWLPGMMIELPKRMPADARKLAAKIDMKRIYADVKRKIAELEREPVSTGRGRRRGLAKT